MNHISVKIRVSYEKPQELHTLLKMLNPVVISCKVGKEQGGAYRKAYMEIRIPDRNAENAQIRR